MQSKDKYFMIDTAIGKLYIAYNSVGISALYKASSDDEFKSYIRSTLGRELLLDQQNSIGLIQEILDYLNGKGVAETRLAFDLTSLSEFQRTVLLTTLKIPRGQVRTYSWLAEQIGNPKASRAVGLALARNPIPILIPCHRVIRSDGLIGNYIFGSDCKRYLLALEGINLQESTNPKSSHRNIRVLTTQDADQLSLQF